MPKKSIHKDITEKEDSLSRRKFVQAGMGAVGLIYLGAAAYPVYRYLADPAEKAAIAAAESEKELVGADALPPGTALMFRFAGKPGILIHLKNGYWVAYNAVCTHLACTVQYQPDKDRIYCACHGGQYDAGSGKNVAGPPPKPLTRYGVEIFDGKVKISRT